MTEGVYMTAKEFNRVDVFLKIKSKQLTQIQAAKELNLSIRHIQRLYHQYKKDGAKALTSKKRGRVSNHQLKPFIKCRVSELITCEIYTGFGPLFMCQTLKKRHEIKISKETTRQLMIANGVWKTKNKKSPAIHQQRQRRERFGELLQIDGSPHYWFEGRGDPCTLIVFIDDATGRIHAKFVKTESTHAYMRTAWEYFIKYGKPLAFYSDKHGIFRVNIPNCNQKEQFTQFGRAAKELDIKLICASSPQAKGRVERVNQTLQDRLVKELRINNISTIEEANQFLEKTYLEEFNNQFTVLPLSTKNAHRKIGKEVDLSEILCEKHNRVVSKNLEFHFENIIYQIKLPKPPIGLIKGRVIVIRKLDGSILVKYKGAPLPVVEYFKQPHNGKIVSSKEIERFLRVKRRPKVSRHHPWMQEGRAEIRREFFKAGVGL
jgi:transposase